MKTIMQDTALDAELQELYILSNHWISDIHFIEDEIRFFKNMIDKYPVVTLTEEQLCQIADFDKSLSQFEGGMPDLKIRILNFLIFIDPLINASNKEIGFNLIEKFITLENEVKTLFDRVKQLKKLLLSFIEEVTKTAKARIVLNHS